MKKILTILVTLTLLLTSAASLAACSGGVSRDEAKEAANALFSALAAEQYAEAAALYHPDTNMTAELMASFSETMLNDMGADFTKGVTVERYTNMRSAYHDSDVGGSFYELTMKVKVGDKSLSITARVVRTEGGYGLWEVNCSE